MPVAEKLEGYCFPFDPKTAIALRARIVATAEHPQGTAKNHLLGPGGSRGCAFKMIRSVPFQVLAQLRAHQVVHYATQLLLQWRFVPSFCRLPF